jgi:hypothetical protein
MSDDRDWVGTWFGLARERGEHADITFALLDHAGQVTWRAFPHQSVDGIAAMAALIGTAELPRMPAAWQERPERPLPSPFMRKQAAQWSALDRAKLGEPSARAHRFLSKEDTARVRAAAKASGVSVNSLLAWALGRAIEGELNRDVGSLLFEVPVNLRGAPLLAALPPTSNIFSTITVDLGAPSPRDVHAAVQTALSRGEHWSSWGSLTIGREQGLEFVRGAAKNAATGVGFRVGVFSNMGVWSGAGHEAIAFCPPPAVRTPLAAGAVTFNERLGLMLLGHANLADYASKLDAWIERWVEASLDKASPA